MTINRGSEWRKWDLHIHSKYSQESRAKLDIKTIFKNAIENNISIISITDHSNFDGLDEIWKIWAEEKIKINEIDYNISDLIDFFPGIELKMSSGKRGIHIIAIFPKERNSKKYNKEYLSSNFLAKIDCSKDDIEKAGKGDYKNGLFEISLDFEKTAKKVHELGGLVIVHAGNDKDHSIEKEIAHHKENADEDELLNSLGPHKENLMLTCIDICELPNKKENSIKFYREKFNKPTVVFSDSHEDYNGNKFSWIKADPTFEGLKQIIYEPLERLKLQENKPIAPVHQISKIHINFEDDVKIKSENRTGKFCFSGVKNKELNLSPYFNCIIGGRGTGKSTLLNLLTKKLLPKKELPFLTKNRIEPLRDDNFIVESTAESIEFLAQNEIERFANNSEELTLAVYDRLVKNNKKIRELESKLNDELSKAQKEISFKGELGQKQSELKELDSRITSKKKIISTYQDGKYKELNQKIESNSTLLNKVKLEKQEFFALKELVSGVIKNHSNKDKENGSGYLKATIAFVTALDELRNNYFNQEFTNEEAEIKTFESNIKNLQDELEDYLKQQGISKENLDDLKEIPELLQIEITQQKEKSEQIKKIEEELKAISLANLQAIKKEYDREVSSQLEKFNNQLKEISEKNPKHIKPIKLEFEFDENKALDGIFNEFIKTYPPYNLQQENIRNSLFSILPKVILDENKTLEDLREKHHHWTKAGNYPIQCLEKDDNFEIYKCWIRKHYYDSITYKKINISYGETNLKDTSFGQRCTAVLIIMLGFGNTPIIIDEPEAHLDSGLIAEYLVELIKKKKQERQIIFATHNANFVINGDAEQILILTEDDKYRHTDFLLSSIENVNNKHQLLKLEGGNDAFKKREKKYNLG